MMLPPFLSANLWKIATGCAAALSIILSALLLSAHFESQTLEHQRDQLTAQIADPQTGYVAKLAQARTNTEQLKAALDQQTEAYHKLSVESENRLADARRKLILAQAQTSKMEKRLQNFLSTTPQGTTLESRIRDIDARALKEFIP